MLTLCPLPLFLVQSARLICPQDPDLRTALPADALLTAVFLQKCHAGGLPGRGYQVLTDRICPVVCALIVLTLIRAIPACRASGKCV